MFSTNSQRPRRSPPPARLHNLAPLGTSKAARREYSPPSGNSATRCADAPDCGKVAQPAAGRLRAADGNARSYSTDKRGDADTARDLWIVRAQRRRSRLLPIRSGAPGSARRRWRNLRHVGAPKPAASPPANPRIFLSDDLPGMVPRQTLRIRGLHRLTQRRGGDVVPKDPDPMGGSAIRSRAASRSSDVTRVRWQPLLAKRLRGLDEQPQP
jgi:hypothetical protein